MLVKSGLLYNCGTFSVSKDDLRKLEAAGTHPETANQLSCKKGDEVLF